MSKTWKIARKVYVNRDHSVSAYTELIKHIFLFNYPHELLMSLITGIQTQSTYIQRIILNERQYKIT